ncbi:indolepyruvate oxidoreductase subunit beta [Lentimicrobium sp.]|jgi:indolepyruvate ferredoxin oxidoreductase beta subunit|uniref:indolepyruvate oxidoreductase subunit beta n=1 Tax=Lentimicrobium sp. TaxID=2034841 RepID=UPI0025FC30CB|nr:indolepyruvate oxidoreductase subunit beta [Lentimicrobium sp.]MCO5257171.1 indolepyruvate oxidoreductase subunit beta [Lentimicrobium sp.]MCO5262218.1 indolepyruvate oxidoreductase subunit beta [Lentimicrobium sp.]HOP14654.1 indolepyruvate oxidoreductase subunit beta [Lentimicrobium sp.]HPF64039.1 indolepyruvate oxidoreductase subunit beta [Lentimicrobium sp.]HPJ63884.1 indolepyruvate oxidoreductase subunit beta [Lentimicrobium sp.]
MKKDIILAGVGGQGILSIAATIGTAALSTGLFLKQAEVHGMSQRGGDVQSNLRISDREIASDLIPQGKADMIISVEPMESLRYLPMLSPDGWLVTNTKPYINIRNYPEMDKLMAEIEAQPRHIALDADEIARQMGSPKSANMVILGAASPFLDIEYSSLQDAIRSIFRKKGDDVIQVNLDALEAGRNFTTGKLNSRT